MKFLFLCCFVFLGQGHAEVALSRLPSALRTYVERRNAEAKALIELDQKTMPSLRYEPRIVAARNLGRDGWLLALQFGFTGERAHVNVTDVVLVTEQGKVLRKYPSVSYMDDRMPHLRFAVLGDLVGATAVRLGGDGLWIVVAVSGSRFGAGRVMMVSAEGDVVQFARENEGYACFSESMIYFDDVDGDGRKEILINRRIHTRLPHGPYDGITPYQYENQKLVYRIGKRGVGIKPLDFSKEQLFRCISYCKRHPEITHIAQYGLPYETSRHPDLGEAIFPRDGEFGGWQYRRSARPDLLRQPDDEPPKLMPRKPEPL
ncbi:hypothetical protein [Luteolibacter sp. LG18]|uniref:hypothetical protein n=1 Tax=Luteolibacter sp. LG18 TaxID=2819286 RepID=UPI002B323031|nr:hypothetical protein llg_29660 [Luteolibacter sp. LG18]